MKRRLLFAGIVAGVGLSVLVSCGKTANEDLPEAVTLRATIEQPVAYAASQAMFGNRGTAVEQRTTIEDGTTSSHQIVWQTNDQIIVHFDTDVEGAMRVFGISSGAGTGEAEFQYVYGYSSDPDVTVPTELPSTYQSILAGYPAMFITITPEDTEVVLEAPGEIYQGLESVMDYPMYGTAGSNGDISFVCPFGLICFPVTGNVTISKIAIDTSYSKDDIADNGIETTGNFLIDKTTYGTTFQSSTSSNDFQIVWSHKSSVTLTDTPTVFYAIMPAGEYGAGVEFQFTTTTGTTPIIMTTQQPFTVTRAQILNLPQLNVSNN